MIDDITKTASFATVHMLVAFGVGYLLSGSLIVASGMALVEPLANTVAYFVHERLWRRFPRRGPVTP